MTKNPALVDPVTLALLPIRIFVDAAAMDSKDLLLRVEIVLDTDVFRSKRVCHAKAHPVAVDKGLVVYEALPPDRLVKAFEGCGMVNALQKLEVFRRYGDKTICGYVENRSVAFAAAIRLIARGDIRQACYQENYKGNRLYPRRARIMCPSFCNPANRVERRRNVEDMPPNRKKAIGTTTKPKPHHCECEWLFSRCPMKSCSP